MDSIAATDTPFPLFDQWLTEMSAVHPVDPNAMSIATVGQDGAPDVRVVLLKEHDARGFVFYTNTQSKTGEDLAHDPRITANFYWPEPFRQIRIHGRAHPVEPTEADAYFASRPRDSQIGAWASQQSRPLPGGRDELLAAIEAVKARHPEGTTVPRPPHWSGYRIVPSRIEFWLGHPYRWHDRLVYTLTTEGDWAQARLYP